MAACLISKKSNVQARSISRNESCRWRYWNNITAKSTKPIEQDWVSLTYFMTADAQLDCTERCLPSSPRGRAAGDLSWSVQNVAFLRLHEEGPLVIWAGVYRTLPSFVSTRKGRWWSWRPPPLMMILVLVLLILIIVVLVLTSFVFSRSWNCPSSYNFLSCYYDRFGGLGVVVLLVLPLLK